MPRKSNLQIEIECRLNQIQEWRGQLHIGMRERDSNRLIHRIDSLIAELKYLRGKQAGIFK